MAKGVRRGREYWAPLIREFEAGGAREEHESFADRHGVRCDSFRHWLYKLRGETQGRRARRATAAKALTASWPLVELQDRRSAPTEGGFVVELVGGTRLRVPPTFDGDALRRLLEILGQAPSS